jgi:hypothetical protein
MNITSPAPGAVFTISADAGWPSIPLQTDAQGAHSWTWTMTWGTFTKSGAATTAGNRWDAGPAITNYGGSLTVVATAGGSSATIALQVKGTNPAPADVAQFANSRPNSDGFASIIQHETKSKHFNAANEPIKSFDKGYGLCQLTNPAPTYEQAWNWKLNVDGGLALFAQKRAAAKTYLSQSGRTFTPEQLKFETVCRWNGGPYHKWNAVAAKWERNPTVLCDSATGNIGWDMTDPANTGQTEAQLHARDKASYSKPPGPAAHWKYIGVCYADRVLH